MLEIVRPPESLPVVTLAPVTRSPSTADFKDLPYSPTLLLSAQFDSALTADPEYQESCEWGYESYFAEMHRWLPDLREFTFHDRIHTLTSVEQYLLCEVVYDPVRNPGSLASRAGWGLGWLSALALTDRPLALSGLELLQDLVLQDEGEYDESDDEESDD